MKSRPLFISNSFFTVLTVSGEQYRSYAVKNRTFATFITPFVPIVVPPLEVNCQQCPNPAGTNVAALKLAVGATHVTVDSN